MQFWVDRINTIGAVYNMWVVSLVMSGFQPRICYGHPNQNGSSMLDNPDVLGINSSVHISIIIMALMAILVFILPFVALAFWADLCYRVSVKRLVRSAHSYFSLLVLQVPSAPLLVQWCYVAPRPFVCSVPVVAYGAPQVQTLLMGAVLLSYGDLVLHMKQVRT